MVVLHHAGVLLNQGEVHNQTAIQAEEFVAGELHLLVVVGVQKHQL